MGQWKSWMFLAFWGCIYPILILLQCHNTKTVILIRGNNCISPTRTWIGSEEATHWEVFKLKMQAVMGNMYLISCKVIFIIFSLLLSGPLLIILAVFVCTSSPCTVCESLWTEARRRVQDAAWTRSELLLSDDVALLRMCAHGGACVASISLFALSVLWKIMPHR